MALRKPVAAVNGTTPRSRSAQKLADAKKVLDAAKKDAAVKVEEKQKPAPHVELKKDDPPTPRVDLPGFNNHKNDVPLPTMDQNITPLSENAEMEKLLIVVRELFAEGGIKQKANLTPRQAFTVSRALWFAQEYDQPELVALVINLLETSVAKNDGKAGSGRVDLRNIMQALFMRRDQQDARTPGQKMFGG